jgi:hypothetical protein
MKGETFKVSFRVEESTYVGVGITGLGFKRYKKLHKESDWRLFTVTSNVKDTNFVKTDQVKNI